jgi:hypothetical protein
MSNALIEAQTALRNPGVAQFFVAISLEQFLMSHSPFKAGTAALMICGLMTGTVAPWVMSAPALAQTTFSDVQPGYWAHDFIQALVGRGVIAGFPDGSFRPDEPVTRAQFAAMVRKAFNKSAIRSGVQFEDVSSSYWAASAIQQAYTTGFLSGYPGNIFRPEQNIPRAQVLVSLASGLEYDSTSTTALSAFADAGEIPAYAQSKIAAATQRQIVVNYPTVSQLAPNQTATRADVAAFIYQALVSSGQAAAIQSAYIVGQATPVPQAVKIPAGTAIPLRYEQAQKILLSPNEPKPAPLTLVVAQNIVTAQGRVLIPAGSQVAGELQTVAGGAQFVANTITLPNGQSFPVNATSNLVSTTETIRKGATTGKIIAGTVVGAGAAAAIAGVTGDRTIKAEEVLGGAAVGALASVLLGRDSVELIVINPNTDLNLTLGSDLVFQ